MFCVFVISVLFLSCQQNEKPANDHDQIRIFVNKLEEESLGQMLEEQTFYIGTDSLEMHPLEELSGLLCFYFSSETCTPCIIRTIDIIKEYISDYETNVEIQFVAVDFPVKYKEGYYGKKVLSLEKNKLSIPLENHFAPFFFLIDGSRKIKSVHVVNKDDYERTADYLREMRDRVELIN